MSYSPFAVLGTTAMIRANREKLNKRKPTEEKKEEKEVLTTQNNFAKRTFHISCRPSKLGGARTVLARGIFIIPYRSTFVKRKVAQIFAQSGSRNLCNLPIAIPVGVCYNNYSK